MRKKIKIDFYQVQMPVGAPCPFSDLVAAVAAEPDDVTRTIPVRDYPMRLQESYLATGRWEIDLLKIRKDDIPPKATMGGEVTAIPMRNDEGLGEHTAALFDIGSSTLVVQRNKYGVSASSIASYFQKKGGLVQPIVLLPIVSKKGWQNFDNLSVVRTLEIATTGFGGANIGARNANVGVADMANLAVEHGAKTSFFRLGMGHAPGGLTRIKELVLGAMGLATGHHEVTRIVVSGKDNGDEKQVIDLLHDRIREEIEVNLGRQESWSYPVRRGALVKAWSTREAEVQELMEV